MSVPGEVSAPARIAEEEVAFAGSGGDRIEAHLARPASGTAEGSMIVIHEAFGPNEHFRDVARRLANLGYPALAPNLYSREGAPKTHDFGELRKLMLAQPDSRIVEDLEGAASFLGSATGAGGPIACLGFCSGGRQTLLYACNTTRLSAAIDCYGGSTLRASPDAETTPERPVPVIEMIEGLACPVMLAVGAEDENPSPEDVELLRERLERAGNEFRVDVYEGAGHAFFADHRPTYREAAAALLWERMTAFLAEHLRG